MSSRCRERAARASRVAARPVAFIGIARLAAVAGMAMLVIGCEREQRRLDEPPLRQDATRTIALVSLQPGVSTQPLEVPRPYEYNAYAVSQGKQLYEWFNCSGCHAHGGGAIGPPLMDAKWIYGSDPANIYATIVQGRPNGMPSFRGRIPERQVWQLVAYVRSMSGELPQDVAPGRNDSMQVKPGENRIGPEGATSASLPPSSQR